MPRIILAEAVKAADYYTTEEIERARELGLLYLAVDVAANGKSCEVWGFKHKPRYGAHFAPLTERRSWRKERDSDPVLLATFAATASDKDADFSGSLLELETLPNEEKTPAIEKVTAPYLVTEVRNAGVVALGFTHRVCYSDTMLTLGVFKHRAQAQLVCDSLIAIAALHNAAGQMKRN